MMEGYDERPEELQVRMNQTTDQSLESTRRMKLMTAEAEEVGVRTLAELDEQGRQLDRIDEAMDEIEIGVKQSERNLTQMEKCCGLCLCPGSSRRVNKERKQLDKMSDKAWGRNEPSSKKKQAQTEQPLAGNSSSDGAYITRVTNDAREDEMEENLRDVGNMLGTLKSMATDMGTELETQNKQIDRITTKAHSNETRIEAVDRRARRQL